MAPHWFELVAWAALGLGFASALVIAADFVLLGNRQHMAIMNFVWPLTALYAGPLALWAYFAHGRRMSHKQMRMLGAERMTESESRDSWWQVSLSDTHCGAGCALGDIGGEWLVWATAWTIGSTAELGPEYILDLPLAWIFGILFQYFVIAPLRGADGPARAALGRDQVRHALRPELRGRPVRLDGASALRDLAAVAADRQLELVVHDASRDDSRLRDQLAG